LRGAACETGELGRAEAGAVTEAFGDEAASSPPDESDDEHAVSDAATTATSTAARRTGRDTRNLQEANQEAQKVAERPTLRDRFARNHPERDASTTVSAYPDSPPADTAGDQSLT
jgi:hypothetical protein